jgi:hypothetical protein
MQTKCKVARAQQSNYNYYNYARTPVVSSFRVHHHRVDLSQCMRYRYNSRISLQLYLDRSRTEDHSPRLRWGLRSSHNCLRMQCSGLSKWQVGIASCPCSIGVR